MKGAELLKIAADIERQAMAEAKDAVAQQKKAAELVRSRSDARRNLSIALAARV
jgi:hypothetical protein